jgi:hypothetical protein
VSLERRLEKLEGRFEPPEDDASGAVQRRKQIREALDELAGVYRREGRAIEDHMAVLQEQGYSYKDAMTIAKNEVLRAANPQLAEFFDSSYPPEIRHDPVAKRDWLESYIESRKRGNFA